MDLLYKPLFGFYAFKWGFWLRVFRKGMLIEITDLPPLFSERYGYAKVIRLGKLKIKYLD